jgi:PAS domain S-box-containing protein
LIERRDVFRKWGASDLDLGPIGDPWVSLGFFCISLTYFALAELGYFISQVHPYTAPIWPAAGFALATCILLGPRIWPAIFCASILANFTMGVSTWTSTSIAAGNTLEALTGWWLITRFCGGRDVFTTPRNILRFTLATVCASAPVGATIGVSSLSLAGLATAESYGTLWSTWWAADAGGILVLCPALVLWHRTLTSPDKYWSKTEALFAVALTVVIGTVSFAPFIPSSAQSDAIAFFAVVPLLWASVRLGTTITSTIGVILAGFAIWGTIQGRGPFESDSLIESLINLVGFLTCVSIPCLALSAELDRRHQRLKIADKTIQQHATALSAASETIREQISEQRHTDQRLLEQAIHLREAQRLANLGSWSWDSASNRVNWSDQLYKIHGIVPGQYEPRLDNYLELVHVEDREKTRKHMMDLIRSGADFRTEERIVRPDGTVRHIRTSAEVVRDESNKPVRMFGVTADVTAEKETLAKLASAQQELLQSQKLEALGKLTGGVAHDFNNLLMVIGASTDLAQRQVNDERVQRKLAAIKSAVERGTALTSQLLTFSRQRVLNPLPVDLGALLARLKDLVTSSLRDDIVLTIDAPLDLWLVTADSAQLELAILNLATNARDAMPEGGTFALTARNVELAGEVQNLRGSFVVLELEDSGTGISPEHLERVFEPFFTTKEVGKGTGLGLSQAHGFARISGGALTVASQTGRTTFALYLPRSPEGVMAEEAEQVPSATTGRGPSESKGTTPLPTEEPPSETWIAGTALVVDDDPNVAFVNGRHAHRTGLLRAGGCERARGAGTRSPLRSI